MNKNAIEHRHYDGALFYAIKGVCTVIFGLNPL